MEYGRIIGAAALVLTIAMAAGCSESGTPVDEGGTGNIAGSVVNPLTNAGIGGITVRAASTLGGTHSTSTNLAGGFTFVGIATGTWSLTIEVPGGLQLAASEPGLRTVVLDRGKTANTQAFHVVPVAQQVGAIAGRVSAGAAGVPGATIALLDDTSNPPTATTDAAGNYGFGSLSVGLYTLRITLPTGYQLAGGQSQERTVGVQAGQTTTVDWSLVAGG